MNKKTNSGLKIIHSSKMAEEEGFEPSVQVSSHGHLANDWFKPLTHSSRKLGLLIVLNNQYL